MIWLPEAQNVIVTHDALVQLFATEEDPISPPGVKSQALLESACGRPHTGVGNVDKYTTLETKAAALFHSLTKNHAFHNGNKRTALVMLLTVLDRNNRRIISTVTDDDLYNFVVSVTADEFPRPDHGLAMDAIISEIARWIKRNTESSSIKAGSMKVAEFLAKCEEAGASVRETHGGSMLVSRGTESIRVGRDTRQIDGAVVKRWLKQLGLSEISGVSLADFRDGAFIARDQIFRFMSTLRRLAKT